jgi:hypothetical protein
VAVHDVYRHRLFDFTIDGHPTSFHHVVLILLDYCNDGRSVRSLPLMTREAF